MKNRAERHLELKRRGVTDPVRREAILAAEDECARRAQKSVFELLRDDERQRERLARGGAAFRPEELTLCEVQRSPNTRDKALPTLISESIN